LDNSVKCAIGESLVLAELLKREHEAYIAHGPTQKGWDIVIVKNNNIRRVQVKAIGWPEDNQRTVTASKFLKFDYLVVVLLNLHQTHSRYLVCDKSEIDGLFSPESNKRIDSSRSWYIAKDINENNKILNLENAWAKVK